MSSKSFLKLCVFLLFVIVKEGSSQFEGRDNLGLRIRAFYDGPKEHSIGIRGNGLGLTWSESQMMLSDNDHPGSWFYDVQYRSDIQGFFCSNGTSSASSGFIPNGDDLKFDFWLISEEDNEEEVRMKGKTKRLKLPQSKVSSHFGAKPTFDYYPYFFSTEGKFEVLEVESLTDEIIGKRQIVVYFPPGFSENAQPEYDIYYVIDLSPNFIEFFKSEFDQIFTSGVSHEAIIIGHGDFKDDPTGFISDRRVQLYNVVGDTFACKEGTFSDYCGHCLPLNLTSQEEYIYFMTIGGCGVIVETGGNADSTVNFLLNEVHEAVHNLIQGDKKTRLTKSRDGTFVIGYSAGGSFACHAIWSRPEKFGGGSCQSSAFFWPQDITEDGNVTSKFNFLKETIPKYWENRLPQKLVIDNGELEKDPIFAAVISDEEIVQLLSTHQMFKLDQNLWYNIYTNETHSYESWRRRLWNAFKLLSRD